MKNIKLCPCCLGKAMIGVNDTCDTPYVVVFCEDCGIRTPPLAYFEDDVEFNLENMKNMAINIWNVRL